MAMRPPTPRPGAVGQHTLGTGAMTVPVVLEPSMGAVIDDLQVVSKIFKEMTDVQAVMAQYLLQTSDRVEATQQIYANEKDTLESIRDTIKEVAEAGQATASAHKESLQHVSEMERAQERLRGKVVQTGAAAQQTTAQLREATREIVPESFRAEPTRLLGDIQESLAERGRMTIEQFIPQGAVGDVLRERVMGFLEPPSEEEQRRQQAAGGGQIAAAGIERYGITGMRQRLGRFFPGRIGGMIGGPGAAAAAIPAMEGAGPIGAGLIAQRGGPGALQAAVGGTGFQGAASLAKFAGPIAIGAYGAFQGVQAVERLAGMGREYSAITGGTGVQEAVGFEARARMMALSPLLGSEEAREIIQTTLGEGYGGRKAENIMDYISTNVKEGLTDVRQNMELYQTAVEHAGSSTETLSFNLDALREVADKSDVSFQGLVKNFQTSMQTLAAGGVGAGAPQLAMQAATFWSQAEAPTLQRMAGPNIAAPQFQLAAARYLGVRVQEVPGAIQGMTTQRQSELALGVAGAEAQRYARVFQGMSQEQIQSHPQLMNIANLLAGRGIIPVELIQSGDRVAVAEAIWRLLNGRINPMAGIEQQKEIFGPQAYTRRPGESQSEFTKRLADTEIMGRTLEDIEGVQGSSVLPWQAEGRAQEGMARKYVGAAETGAFRSPYMEQLLSMKGVNFRTMGIRDPDSGELMQLGQFVDKYGFRRAGANLSEGTAKIVRLREGQESMFGTRMTEGLKFKSLSEFVGGGPSPFAAGGEGPTQQTVVELGPVAQRFFYKMDQTDYYGFGGSLVEEGARSGGTTRNRKAPD